MTEIAKKNTKNYFKENETAFCVVIFILFLCCLSKKSIISKRYAFLDIHFFIFMPDIYIYEEIILFHKSFHFHVY